MGCDIYNINYNIDYNIDYNKDYNIDYNIDYKSPICSGTSACSSSPCQDGICVPVSETERVCMCERNVTPDEQGSCGESPYM